MSETRIMISGADIYTPDECIEGGSVLIENGRIAALSTQAEPGEWVVEVRIDARGLLLTPGLVELQINGAYGMDFTADPATIFPAAEKLPAFGVTSFLPTIITSPLERIEHAQAVLQAGPPEDFCGSIPLGLHVEGPFLNLERKGAHSPEFLRRPSPDLVANWSPESGVRLVTLAPEVPGALETIAALSQQGVVVSAGHSMATYAQAQAGFEAGIRYATHLFNAMSPLTQFDPGLPGAVLSRPDLAFGLIADGIHVHPALAALVWKLSGVGRLTLVSDAMAALGMPPGKYVLGKQEVIVDETSARLTNGVLAGSILTHTDALRNLMRYTGCSLSEALSCLTTTPAGLLGLDDELGRIAPGLRADLVLMTPDLQVVRTLVGGRQVFYKEDEETG